MNNQNSFSNKTIEALKMAIDKAITEFEILSSFPQYSFDYVDLIKELSACKEALAEAEKQEPVAWYGIGDMYVWKRNLEEDKDATLKVVNRPLANNENWKPLYTHPATWQSLSDDEIKLFWLFITLS